MIKVCTILNFVKIGAVIRVKIRMLGETSDFVYTQHTALLWLNLEVVGGGSGYLLMAFRYDLKGSGRFCLERNSGPV